MDSYFKDISHAPQVPVTDFEEQLAVWEGRIEGFVYDDGEVWAYVASLTAWRQARETGWDANGSEVA